MTRILVTGGAGLIGANLVKKLIALGHEVSVADNFWRGKRSNLLYEDGQPVIDFASKLHNVDLREHTNCLDVTENIETVIHLADIVAGINYVFANELSLWRSNILINSNVVDACIKNGVSNYIYVGTACSYPMEMQSVINPPPFKEEDVYPAQPESAYGWSKLMGEYEAHLAGEASGMNIGMLRLHNVYGPPCELAPEKSQVIPALCRKAIAYPDEPFIVWGSGNQRRAFVYVDDVIDALVSLLEKGMNQGVIQIGPSTSTSIRAIAEKIVRISGKDINIQYDLTKPEGDMDRMADWSKARKVLGWSPKVDIDDGLQRTFEWCAKFLA